MVIVFGSINLDLIFSVPTIPRPGETVLGPSIRIEPGGKGANQAVAAARDGAVVVMAGAIGRDALGDGALNLLRQAAVNLDRVRDLVLLESDSYELRLSDGQRLPVDRARGPELRRRLGLDDGLSP